MRPISRGLLCVAAALATVALWPPAAQARGYHLIVWPAAVPARGGSVHMLARVPRGASACLFSSTMLGLVQEFLANRDCQHGTARATAKLPPNYDTAPRSFVFELRVDLGGGAFVERQASVLQRGRKAARTDPQPTWSGYVATHATFGIVGGDFNVAAISCPPGATTVSSQWVGIDGFGGSTVEQDGVEMSCVNGSPSYSAWYEMYGDPAVNGGYEVALPSSAYPVSPGDSMSAGVSSPTPNDPLDPHRYTWFLSLFDYTAGWVFSTTIAAPNPAPPQDTAEWIVELPSTKASSLLSDFGTASFTSAYADSLGDSSGGAISMFPHRSLKMAPGGHALAAPSALTSSASDSSFSVTWLASS